MVPDEHSGDYGRYALTSLYYDSPVLRCYYQKEAGIKFRRKLRIRRYENCAALSDETPVFVEIKQHINRVTQKRRAILPYAEALRFCKDLQIPEYAPDDQAVID